MTIEYVRQALYGGAITAELPKDCIDASDLREVPDHQEIFLRSDTLTNIIFEINEYQSTGDVITYNSDNEGLVNAEGTKPATGVSSADAAAANHHLKDTVAQEDRVSESGIQTTAVKLPQTTVAKFPAYFTTATIVETEVDRSRKDALPVNWQAQPPLKENHIKTEQLLVRLEEYGTDLCVRLNVPMKEYEGLQSESALTEMAKADQMMQKIIETITIKDFGLFGGEVSGAG